MQLRRKIYGPPGSGKTTTLIAELRAELEAGTPIHRIAYLSHSKAAAREAYDRAAKGLELKKEPPWFCTIHAAARRLCAVPPHNIIDDADFVELEQRTGLQFAGRMKNVFASDRPEMAGDVILQCLNLSVARQCSLEEAALEMGEYDILQPFWIDRVLSEYRNVKRDRVKFDFDDLLLMYARDPDAEPLPVDVLFVDEAQDLSTLQWKVIALMGKAARKVICVGDDDQSIYRFLGADPYGFLDWHADEETVLPVSWRVPVKIGLLANEIIGRVSRRKEKEFRWAEKDGVINHVALPSEFLNPGPGTMVIVRHNEQVRNLSKRLTTEGVLHTINGLDTIGTPAIRRLLAVETLRQGGAVPAKEVAHLLRSVQGKADSVKRLMASQDRLIRKDDIDVNWKIPWPDLFARDRAERSANRAAQAAHFVSPLSLDDSEREGRLDLSTYHASKGREAEHVILLTDVYRQAWEKSDQFPDDERRLAYVGVTRAKQSITIVSPETNMYMRSLVDA